MLSTELSKKPLLKIHFSDFWDNFQPTQFWIFQLLSQNFNVCLDKNNPDLLVFSQSGIGHLKYKCHKIYYSHENTMPNPFLADFSFSFHGKGGAHQFFSNFIEEPLFQQLILNKANDEILAWKRTLKNKFCNFVYSNCKPRERIAFCKMLSQYKHVDCPGKVLNNQPPFDSHGYQYNQKLDFQKRYKFTIAFENVSRSNYTTEKIIHPLLVGSIPIYWGNPDVAKLFNPKSFINCHDFGSFEEVICYIKKVDQDESLYSSYLSSQPILDNSPLSKLTQDYFTGKLIDIVNTSRSTASISTAWQYELMRLKIFLQVKLRNRVDDTLRRVGGALPSVDTEFRLFSFPRNK